MTIQSMFGVVLWSDTNAQKAVIWCEDQGELAFYTPCEQTVHDAPALDAGDLIQFDVIVQKNMRKATNPQVLEQSHSPDLPSNLRASRPDLPTSVDQPNVVSLNRHMCHSDRARVLRSG